MQTNFTISTQYFLYQYQYLYLYATCYIRCLYLSDSFISEHCTVCSEIRKKYNFEKYALALFVVIYVFSNRVTLMRGPQSVTKKSRNLCKIIHIFAKKTLFCYCKNLKHCVPTRAVKNWKELFLVRLQFFLNALFFSKTIFFLFCMLRLYRHPLCF